MHPDGAFFAAFFGNGNTEKGFFRDGKSALFVRDVKKPPSRFARRTEKRLHGGKKRREREKTGTAKHGGKRQYNTTLCCLLRLKSKTSPENPYAYHITS